LLRGELDWIVMKALDKDRNRRYESASAFAADVQRYLHDEPVLACPPSAWYRFRKFARRNKGPVLATSLVVLALIAGIIRTTWGMFRAVDAEGATAAAAQQKEQANRRTRAALDRHFSIVLQGWLERQQLTEEHKKFLQEVLEDYEAFTREVGETPEQRQELGY